MTRDQIPVANQLVGASSGNNKTSAPTDTSTGTSKSSSSGVTTANGSTISASRPAIPGDIAEYFLPASVGFNEALTKANLPATLTAEGIVYKAGLFLQAETRYLSRQNNLEYSKKTSAVLENPGSGLIKWENISGDGIDTQKLETQPLPKTQFHTVPAWIGDAKKTADIQKDFQEWIYRSGSLKLKSNTALKVVASPEMNQADFRKKCTEAAQSAIEKETAKVEQTFATKISALQRKIDSQELDLKAAENAVSQRNLEGLATGGAAVLGMLTGRKRSLSSTISKVRMASAAKDKKIAEEETLKQLNEQLQELQKTKEAAIKEVNDKWADVAAQENEITVNPTKSDIFMEVFGAAWMPYYIVENEGKKLELQAFEG